MEISILVPIFNTEEYLDQCLKSIQNQTFSDFEVICINDGSTDDSVKIIEKYAHSDSRFVLLNKENTGYGHSMNEGLKVARGRYIGIVESDDYILPQMFEKLYRAIEDSDSDVAKTDFFRVENNDTLIKFDNLLKLPLEEAFCPMDYLETFKIHPSIWTSLYRKTFLEENNIKFLETPGASFQDISFSFKVLTKAKRMFCLQEPLMCYRVFNLDSSIHDSKKIWCVCDELEEIERYSQLYHRSVTDQKRLDAVIAWVKFINYVWNYDRLSFGYKYAFLIRMNEEFQNISENEATYGILDEIDLQTFYIIRDRMDDYFAYAKPNQSDERLQYYNLLNDVLAIKGFETTIEEYKNIIIYGAGVVGKEVYSYLQMKGLTDKISAFVVSKKEQLVTELNGRPIIEISEVESDVFRNSLILVSAVKEKHYDMVKSLKRFNEKNVLVITPILRAFMKNYGN